MTRRIRGRGELSQDRAMPRSIRGRADLIRALGHSDPSITAAMAALLGYHETPVTAPELISPPAEPTQPPQTEPPVPLGPPYAPADVPFWRLEAYEALLRDDTPPGRSPRPNPDDLVWRKRPSQLPGFTPLAPRRTILTRLRQVSAIRHTTSEVDSVAVVEKLSRGDLMQDIPHRSRRAWGSEIHIIEDRARRLVPYWLDQDYVTDVLRHLYPPHGVTIARIGDGDSYPTIRWPEERRGAYGLPVPHTLVVVLSDLGCLAKQGDNLRRFWLQWGRRLRDNGNPAVALVPAQLKDIPTDLAHTWTVVRWDVGTAVGADGALQSTENTVQRLLTLLSPVVRLEPGLLRAVRCLLPEGRRDPGLEARVWQDAAISSPHSVAATLDPEQRKAYLVRFADQPRALREAVLRLVRTWRANVHAAIWFEEVLGLDAPSQHELIDTDDLQDALRFWPAFTEALRQSGHASTDTEAWIYRLTQRLPDIACQDPGVRQAVHELFELVRPYLDETQVPTWYDPAVLSAVGQPVRQVTIWQVADQLLLRVVEPSSPADSHRVTRGSPLGIVHTASGEVKIASSQFWHGGQPPEWAQGWGHDACGPWVTFRVGAVEQRMRWIPPGRFQMGSPPEEEGRHGDEGPQHDVQLTRGFWLCDTPCTQALWQAVMDTDPRASITASATPVPAVPGKSTVAPAEKGVAGLSQPLNSPDQSVRRYDFFIAYATPDRRLAQDLCWFLQDDACEVFLDVQALSPGAVWPPALREALEASRAIVVLVSTHTDEAFYQQEEIVQAIQLARDKPRAHTVIPVILEKLPYGAMSMPYGLSSRQALDATRSGGLRRVAAELVAWLNDHQLNAIS